MAEIFATVDLYINSSKLGVKKMCSKPLKIPHDDSHPVGPGKVDPPILKTNMALENPPCSTGNTLTHSWRIFQLVIFEFLGKSTSW